MSSRGTSSRQLCLSELTSCCIKAISHPMRLFLLEVMWNKSCLMQKEMGIEEQRELVLEYGDLLKISLAGLLRDYELETWSGEVKKGKQIFYGPQIAAYCREPWENVNYSSCHDNATLFDQVRYYPSGSKIIAQCGNSSFKLWFWPFLLMYLPNIVYHLGAVLQDLHKRLPCITRKKIHSK